MIPCSKCRKPVEEKQENLWGDFVLCLKCSVEMEEELTGEYQCEVEPMDRLTVDKIGERVCLGIIQGGVWGHPNVFLGDEAVKALIEKLGRLIRNG